VLKDLPKKTEIIEWCEMTPRQNTIYRDALQRSRKFVVEVEESEVEPIAGGAANGKPKATKRKTRANQKPTDKTYLENSSNVLMDLRKAALHPMLFRTHFTSEILTAMAKQLLKEPEFKKRKAVFEYVKEDMEVMTDAELQAFCASYKVCVISGSVTPCLILFVYQVHSTLYSRRHKLSRRWKSGNLTQAPREVLWKGTKSLDFLSGQQAALVA
jgi:SNF2 family DNA or RNA helicase